MSRLLLIALIPSLCFASLPNEEALFVNRIADFWQEEEYSLAKEQILEFLQLYPESSYKNFLHSAIGDLYLKENDFKNALKHYQSVTDREILVKISTNLWYCLYQLEEFNPLVTQIQKSLQESTVQDVNQAEIYLASALYKLCLQSSDTQSPYFDEAIDLFKKIYETNPDTELAHFYAHILYLNNQKDEAISIYQKIGSSQKNPEMLFQAALLQSETDPQGACKSFQELSNFESLEEKTNLEKEALFNVLVLAEDLKEQDFITENYAKFLNGPDDKKASIYLILAKNFAKQNKHVEARDLFLKSIDLESISPPELETALYEAFEIASQLKDVDTCVELLDKMNVYFARDVKTTSCAIVLSHLFQEMGSIEKAEETIEDLLTTSNHLDLVYLEIISKTSKSQDFARCREFCEKFCKQYPKHEQSLFVEENLVFALNHIQDNSAIENLSFIVASSTFEQIQNLSKYFLAKYFISQKDFDTAFPFLETCVYPEMDGSIALLKAIYYKEKQDLPKFVEFAEIALEKGTVSKGEIHASLFDGYFSLKNFEKAKFHLYSAFENHIVIPEESLFWLLKEYYAEKKFPNAKKLAKHLFENSQNPLHGKYLAKIYFDENKFEKAIHILKSIGNDSESDENSLLLATCYEALEDRELALQEYEKILSTNTYFHDLIPAKAALNYAKLKMQTLPEASLEDPNIRQILNLLKMMTLQKNPLHEPLYLEAAFTYVDILTQLHPNDSEKRLSLLEKMKNDFLKEENILEIDYHKIRTKDPKIGEIFSCYMHLLDAEIAAENAIKENAGSENICMTECFEALQAIVDKNLHPELTARAERCLQP